MQEKSNRANWGKLFSDALSCPGKVSEAYSVFHDYSLGNAILAAMQLTVRGLALTPIASFNKWKKLGRCVKKGEKAIALVMPVTVKAKFVDEVENGAGSNDNASEAGSSGRTMFVLKNNWFSLDQTEGADYTVSPVALMPWKTLFHEMAHCLMHSTEAQMADGDLMRKDIKEAEAEAVAYLCCATLGLPGLEESRDYIQGWLGSKEQSEEFGKKSASRVFSAADKILKAGTKSAQVDEVSK